MTAEEPGTTRMALSTISWRLRSFWSASWEPMRLIALLIWFRLASASKRRGSVSSEENGKGWVAMIKGSRTQVDNDFPIGWASVQVLITADFEADLSQAALRKTPARSHRRSSPSGKM